MREVPQTAVYLLFEKKNGAAIDWSKEKELTRRVAWLSGVSNLNKRLYVLECVVENFKLSVTNGIRAPNGLFELKVSIYLCN